MGSCRNLCYYLPGRRKVFRVIMLPLFCGLLLAAQVKYTYIQNAQTIVIPNSADGGGHISPRHDHNAPLGGHIAPLHDHNALLGGHIAPLRQAPNISENNPQNISEDKIQPIAQQDIPEVGIDKGNELQILRMAEDNPEIASGDNNLEFVDINDFDINAAVPPPKALVVDPKRAVKVNVNESVILLYGDLDKKIRGETADSGDIVDQQDDLEFEAKMFGDLKNLTIKNDPPFCKPFVGCEYEDEIGLRIIILTQSRWKHLNRTLNSLSHFVTLSDTIAIEIWIDTMPTGALDKKTYKVARDFKWRRGTKRVHVRDAYVGILGQLYYTWRPRPGSKELAIILEDDVDLSPHCYRFLKHSQKVFGNDSRISGYCLQDEHVYRTNRQALQRRVNEKIFMYPMHGPWAFSPHVDRWREFQDWLTIKRQNTSFKPYVPPATTHMEWYARYELRSYEDKMPEMWYYRFAFERKLWAVHSNLRAFSKRDRGLSFNRRELGIHYTRKVNIDSKLKLMLTWDDGYLIFPEKVRMVGYNGHSFGQYLIENNEIVRKDDIRNE